MDHFIVKKDVVIHAPPQAVWDALTNPEKTKHYFFHCRVFSDWKPGSSITFKGRMFLVMKIELTGKILEIEPSKLLKYNLKNRGGSDDSGVSIVTDRLSYQDGKTTLSVTDDVGNSDGAEKRFKRSQKGWGKVLNGLKKLVEKT